MSTVRRFNASCPDCGRWRCVCAGDGCPDCGEFQSPCACVRRESAAAYDACMAEGERLIAAREAAHAAPVRTGPPPDVIRERLQRLRADIAAHLPHLGRA